jgi:hypothetical protein
MDPKKVNMEEFIKVSSRYFVFTEEINGESLFGVFSLF